MARHIYLVPGIDKAAMHERAQKLIDDDIETLVKVHAHLHANVDGCNAGCKSYEKAITIGEDTDLTIP